MSAKATRKIVMILDPSLERGVAINTATHIAVQLGCLAPEVRGTEVVDSSGDRHAGVPIYPNVVLQGTAEQIKEVVAKARAADVVVVDFPKAGYETSTDEEFVAKVAEGARDSIVYFGVAIYGETANVNRLTRGLTLLR